MTQDLVLVLANLKMRKLGGIVKKKILIVIGYPSTGMVLCASAPDGSAVELLRPDPSKILFMRINCRL